MKRNLAHWVYVIQNGHMLLLHDSLQKLHVGYYSLEGAGRVVRSTHQGEKPKVQLEWGRVSCQRQTPIVASVGTSSVSELH
jgi:hypothetical protein